MDSGDSEATFTDTVTVEVALTFERDSLLGQMALSMSDGERVAWETRAARKMFEPHLEAINTGDNPTMIVSLP
jgi:hypothetical protein